MATCSPQLPHSIFHYGRVLHLQPQTPWLVNCNACGYLIQGFHYHYRDDHCWFYIHPYCASLCDTLYLPQRHPHRLSLVFYPPYPNGPFTCNLCGQPGGCHWLYWCRVCRNFYVHLGCAIREDYGRQVLPPQGMHTTPNYNQPHGGPSSAWRPSFNPGNVIVNQVIGFAVQQLIGQAFGGFLPVDVGSSLFDNLMQLIQGSWS